MKLKAYQVSFRTPRVVLLAAFLSTIFFTDANLTFADSVQKNPPTVAGTSAADHAEARIKQLQEALKITEAQGKLWNNVVRAMRENAKDMDAIAKDRAASTKIMNAVEHMELRSHIAQARLDQLKKFIPPFQTLYISMSEEQKKNTDQIFLSRED